MTPQLISQMRGADAHLTEDQFGELFLAPGGRASFDAEAHVLVCEQCAAELAGLRESLSLFRQASSTHAETELQRLPQTSIQQRPVLLFEPAYLVAAAALFLAALLPMQTLRRYVHHPAPAAMASVGSQPATESDEALLSDVDREISASVPTSMQALADPSSGGIDPSVPTSTQRKD